MHHCRPILLLGAVLLAVVACSGPPMANAAPDSNAAVTVTVPGQPASTAVSPPDGIPADQPPTAASAGSADDPYPYENTAPEISVAQDTTPWPAPPADPTAAVTAAVAAAAAVGVEQAVVIIDRNSGAVLTQINADEPYPTLSLVKLMIAADVLTGESQGQGSGDLTSLSTSSNIAQPPTGTASPTTRSSSATSGTDAVTRARLREMIARSDDVTASDFYEAGGADELINRVVERFSLSGSGPTPDGEYWGNVQTTATDMAALIGQILADPALSSVIGPAMKATAAYAEDGVDQRFGMRVVPGAGSKQGWGCCLSGVTGVHSVGFTDDRIVVVLSGAEPDDYSLGSQDGLALEADAGGQVSMAALTATVRAALGGPPS